MSNSLQPHGLWPTRLLHPWNFSGKRIGVGCHFLLQGIFLTQGSNSGLPHCRQTLCHLSHQGSLVAQSCPNLCDPMDCTYQAPLSLGVSRQEYLSGLPCPLPGYLPNPGIKPRSPALQADSLHLSHQGSPRILEWVAMPSSRGSSQARDQTQVSCIASRFFTI